MTLLETSQITSITSISYLSPLVVIQVYNDAY